LLWLAQAGALPLAALGLLGATLAGVGYLTAQRRADLAAVRALPLLPGNPVVFLDVADGDAPVGRLVVALRADVAPRAAANFLALCTRSRGWGYASSPLHGGEARTRLFFGDFFGNGAGAGFSIFGERFEDEALHALRHIGPGTVSMRSAGPDANGSAFFVALRRLPEFDGVAQVVGHVVEGFEVLDTLDKALASSGRFEKAHDFRIARAGELRGYAKPAPADAAAEDAALMAAAVAAADTPAEPRA
jgi:cyclophilin family peptidyl-prolyl cis-trans isomerase